MSRLIAAIAPFVVIGSLASVVKAQDWIEIAPDDLIREGGFGSAVATVEDYILISNGGDPTRAPYAGSVMVYEFDDTSFTLREKILPDFGRKFGAFGNVLATDDNNVLITSTRIDTVYHYQLIDGQFIERDKLYAPLPIGRRSFGREVKITGDWAFVTARSLGPDEAAIPFDYAVVVYKLEGDNWEYHSVLAGTVEWNAGSSFGSQLCALNNSLVVSAPYDSEFTFQRGALYIYELEGGEWILGQKLMIYDYESREGWGIYMDCDENEIVLANADTRRAIEFEKQDTGWGQVSARIALPDTGDRWQYIFNITVQDNWLFIARIEHPGNKDWVGIVYSYRRDEGNWIFYKRLHAPCISDGDDFGGSIVLTDKFAIFSASIRDKFVGETCDNYVLDETGAVYIAQRGSFLPIIENPQPKEIPEIPSFTAFQPAYPNPAEQLAYLDYTVTDSAPVGIVLFDVMGREIRSELVALKSPGEYTEEIDVSSLPSGVYFYRISIGRLTATKSLTVIH
ncbi:MAG: hypothetical protein BMS9Abin05_1722 [Rhodothermia bacterium]|nr:MAG: hypothetical protein BMS9Abin05_1722 [Rhodothermia bacterium]